MVIELTRKVESDCYRAVKYIWKVVADEIIPTEYMTNEENVRRHCLADRETQKIHLLMKII